jgi:hypothetical protein
MYAYDKIVVGKENVAEQLESFSLKVSSLAVEVTILTYMTAWRG